VGGLRRDERLLRGVAIELRRNRQHRKRLRRFVELCGARLVHQRRPVIAVMILGEAQRALGGILLEDRDRKGLNVAGLGVEPAERRIAEIGEIDAAVRIEASRRGLIGRLRQL
jgi:hypothetical protein